MSKKIEGYKSFEVVVLYRPLGQKEYELVKESNFKKWPPRLPEQPIFYPVLNEAYAAEIAQKWNTKDSDNGNVGYVSVFRVKKTFIDSYEVQIVGGSQHEELWIPAEKVEEMNDAIVGEIEIIQTFK